MNPIEMPIEHKADGPKCYAEYVKRYLNFALNDLEGRFRLAQEGTTEKCEKLDENDWGGLEIVERQHPGPNERYVYLKANDPWTIGPESSTGWVLRR